MGSGEEAGVVVSSWGKARSIGSGAARVRRRAGRLWVVKKLGVKVAGSPPDWWERVARARRSSVGLPGWRAASVRTGRPSASKWVLVGVRLP
jgi:hypothetical protein